MNRNSNSEGNPKDERSVDKSYVCYICGWSCSKATPASLRNHRLTHSGEKPYECPVCLKCFADGSYLRKHYRLHTGEKPYSCDVCQRRFTQSSHLKSHTRVHREEKPWRHRCIFCVKAFNFMSQLKVHLRIHTNEKPYVCDFCQKAYHTKQSFDIHILTHSVEKPFSCGVCPKQFKSKRGVQRHKKMHNDLKTTKELLAKLKATKEGALKATKEGALKATKEGTSKATKEGALKIGRPKNIKPAVSSLGPRKICPKPYLITATGIKLPLPLEVKGMPQATLNLTPQQKMDQWRNISQANQKPKSRRTVSKVVRTQLKMHADAPENPKRVIIEPQKSNLAIAPKSAVTPFATVPLAPMVVYVTCPLIQTKQES